jgi:hypothetical protein
MQAEVSEQHPSRLAPLAPQDEERRVKIEGKE